MAYIVPNSLSITPSSPDTKTPITFSFQGAMDDIDLLSVLGFNTTIYVLYRASSQLEWKLLTSWKCNGCYGALTANPNGTWNTQGLSISVDPITSAGTYDFLVIDYGDYIGKVAPYDTTRSAEYSGFSVVQYHDPNQPSISITSDVANASVLQDGIVKGYGSATLYGNLGQSTTITVEATGYTTFTQQVTFSTGNTNVDAVMTACDTSTPGCYGYVAPGGVTSGTTSNATCGATDYICILTPYAPYIIAGGLVLLYLITTPPKQSGGGNRPQVIIERSS